MAGENTSAELQKSVFTPDEWCKYLFQIRSTLSISSSIP